MHLRVTYRTNRHALCLEGNELSCSSRIMKISSLEVLFIKCDCYLGRFKCHSIWRIISSQKCEFNEKGILEPNNQGNVLN